MHAALRRAALSRRAAATSTLLSSLCVRTLTSSAAASSPATSISDGTPTSTSATATPLSLQMRQKGFVHATPNFSPDFADVNATMEQTGNGNAATMDVTSTPAVDVDVVRDMHGPWLVMTDDLQGELYIDHDRVVFYRPAHGLGYGVGTLQLFSAGATGTAFTLHLEVYAYAQTDTQVPLHPTVLDVTGIVQRVTARDAQYSTFALNGVWVRSGGSGSCTTQQSQPQAVHEDTAATTRSEKDKNSSSSGGDKDDIDKKSGDNNSSSTKSSTDDTITADGVATGQFHCAKITPWDVHAQPTWQPAAELQQALHAAFPDVLRLDSHVRRATAAKEAAACTATGNNSNSNNKGNEDSTHEAYHVQLAPYAVGAVPGVYYIPDYITADEEQQMLAQIARTPAELKSKLTKRTAQEWGCSMCDVCKQSFVHDVNMPPWVQQYTDMLLYDGIFTPSTFPNSVRIHEYEAGEGIGPHCDGPIYVPMVTVLSMASTSVMRFYPRRAPYDDRPMQHYEDTFVFGEGVIGAQRPLQSVVLEPRSMLIFAGEAYYYYPHGVLDQLVDSLAYDVAGDVVNRRFLHDKDVCEVPRRYRVSITTRNLLPRCNHQPARTEYGMKRAWYVYRQQPVPSPLFTPSPLLATTTPTTPTLTTTTTTSAPGVHTTATTTSHANDVSSSSISSEDDATTTTATTQRGSGSVGPLTRAQLRRWEQRLDAVLTQQTELKRSVEELRQAMNAFMASEQSYRTETSVLLNTLSSSVLDVDAKVDDLADTMRRSSPP